MKKILYTAASSGTFIHDQGKMALIKKMKLDFHKKMKSKSFDDGSIKELHIYIRKRDYDNNFDKSVMKTHLQC